MRTRPGLVVDPAQEGVTMYRTFSRASLGAGLAVMVLIAACGGGAATPTPAVPTQPAASGSEGTASPAATQGSTGEPALDAAAEIQAGTEFEVAWTGPNEPGDYVTIVKLGTAEWTNEDYFNCSGGSPQNLTAPTEAGDYELWLVSGASKEVLIRRPVKVLAFVGSLDAPASVGANTEFDVAWSGPSGSGDYVTIVKLGAEQWTNEDYFNAIGDSPQKLLAPVAAGAYELWYVTGSDRVTQIRRPIVVIAATATVQAPADVAKGAQFQVGWTGPSGPSDYVTIVPAGSPPNTYLSYFNATDGSPGTLTAPDTGGDYEIWYVVGQDHTVLATAPIKVR
jgi:Ca-activated chloride channel homolog